MAALAPFPAGFTRPDRGPDWKQCSVPTVEEIVVYAVALDDPAGLQGKREIFRGPVGQAWECWLQAGGIPA